VADTLTPIKPVFKLWNAEQNCWQWGLAPEDFYRVMAGYACGKCLEVFNHWIPACYICGEPTPNQTPGELPPEWRKQADDQANR